MLWQAIVLNKSRFLDMKTETNLDWMEWKWWLAYRMMGRLRKQARTMVGDLLVVFISWDCFWLVSVTDQGNCDPTVVNMVWPKWEKRHHGKLKQPGPPPRTVLVRILKQHWRGAQTTFAVSWTNSNTLSKLRTFVTRRFRVWTRPVSWLNLSHVSMFGARAGSVIRISIIWKLLYSFSK